MRRIVVHLVLLDNQVGRSLKMNGQLRGYCHPMFRPGGNLSESARVSDACTSAAVLAQDHFFSDFLRLHLTVKAHKVSQKSMFYMFHLQTAELRCHRGKMNKHGQHSVPPHSACTWYSI